MALVDDLGPSGCFLLGEDFFGALPADEAGLGEPFLMGGLLVDLDGFSDREGVDPDPLVDTLAGGTSATGWRTGFPAWAEA